MFHYDFLMMSRWHTDWKSNTRYVQIFDIIYKYCRDREITSPPYTIYTNITRGTATAGIRKEHSEDCK